MHCCAAKRAVEVDGPACLAQPRPALGCPWQAACATAQPAAQSHTAALLFTVQLRAANGL